MLEVVPEEATGASLCWGERTGTGPCTTQSQAACVPKDLNACCPAGPKRLIRTKRRRFQSQSSGRWCALPSVLHDASPFRRLYARGRTAGKETRSGRIRGVSVAANTLPQRSAAWEGSPLHRSRSMLRLAVLAALAYADEELRLRVINPAQ